MYDVRGLCLHACVCVCVLARHRHCHLRRGPLCRATPRQRPSHGCIQDIGPRCDESCCEKRGQTTLATDMASGPGTSRGAQRARHAKPSTDINKPTCLLVACWQKKRYARNMTWARSMSMTLPQTYRLRRRTHPVTLGSRSAAGIPTGPKDPLGLLLRGSLV
jgi:hypothetical protein